MLVTGVAVPTVLVALGIPASLAVLMLALFHSLTVKVSQNEIVLLFGVGILRKRFLIEHIESINTVRNRWYHGFGIKRYARGWLYNIHGFDAIEVHRKNGKQYRIGTDQPEELQAAIEAAVARSQ